MEPNTLKEFCLSAIKNEWLAASTSFPDFFSEVSQEIKEQNEHYIQSIRNNFQKQIKGFSHFPIIRKRWRRKTLHLIETLLYTENIIGIHNCMDKEALNLFQQELSEFLCHARAFAPELSIEDIGQATRNYIVYAMFKQMSGKNTGYNPACFGYSMLYPFTDNYIDSAKISNQQKQEYNQIIRDKIEGKSVHSRSLHAHKTCDLLQMIENVYPRVHNKDIYTLLLLMLEAQEDSLRQQNTGIHLSIRERLDISLFKGGISVLIDYFFVNKEITEKDLYFYLGFGFFLQLADDLQDIKEDSSKGHQTLFTVDLGCQAEEMLVNKMLHFIHHITNSYHAPDNHFKDFLLSNCYQLIFISISESTEYFSKAYLDKLEQFLPISFPFLKSLRQNRPENKDTENQEHYIQMLDELIKKDCRNSKRKYQIS